MERDIYARIGELGIEIPPTATPAAAYVPSVRAGNLLFVSGHIPRRQDGTVWAGQLGRDISLENAKQAARQVGIDLIGTLQGAVGNLNSVRRIVKLLVLVNSSAEFTEHHLVANGASQLLGEVFGDAGLHARSAFGAAQLPLGACVEIELVAELAPV